MKACRGSLFYYGPRQQTLVLDGVLRDSPQFLHALFAENWAAKKGVRFADHSDPADFRLAGRPARPRPAFASPAVSMSGGAGQENAASEASRLPCYY